MPRPLRIENPGAICHVMNRGDRREPIFKDGRDHPRYLATPGEELTRRGWPEAELRGRAKGDVEKVRMALRLRPETTVTLNWIAEHLAIGSWTSVAHHRSRPQRTTEAQPELQLP